MVVWISIGALIYLRTMFATTIALLADRYDTMHSKIIRAIARGLVIAMLLGPFAGLRGRRQSDSQGEE